MVTLARMALERKLDLEYQQQQQQQQQQLQRQAEEEEQQLQQQEKQSPLDAKLTDVEQSCLLGAAHQQHPSASLLLLDVHQPKELDLQERYRSKGDHTCCFGWLPLPTFLPGFCQKRLYNS